MRKPSIWLQAVLFGESRLMLGRISLIPCQRETVWSQTAVVTILQ